MDSAKRHSVSELRALAVRILCGHGVPEAFAETQTDLLIEAELRGLPSHGLLRLGRIVERIQNGVTNPTTAGKHTWRAPAFLYVDGEMGLGPVVALAALEKVCEKAREFGIAVAAIADNNHLGMLGWYAERVAKNGQIALAWTTSEALVHPWGGARAMLGTNPMAIAVPGEPHPFLIDVATGIVSMGKIHDHAHRQQPLPEGWALDKDGNPTTDAVAAKDGAIAPFGEGKGYALGLAFEILVASLTECALGRDVHGTLDPVHRCNKGDVFIVIDTKTSPHVADRVARYLDAVRDCPHLPGFDAVLVPGDRALKSRKKILAEGIPVADEIWQKLLTIAKSTPQQI